MQQMIYEQTYEFDIYVSYGLGGKPKVVPPLLYFGISAPGWEYIWFRPGPRKVAWRSEENQCLSMTHFQWFYDAKVSQIDKLGSSFWYISGESGLVDFSNPLVRKHRFRDLEDVEICSFRWLFQRWFQEGFQRQTFRDLGEFRCQMGINFGLP